ncbi:MAG: ferritin family protein [bacterium]|nr:ferritin family protein [bacterium]
MPEIFYMSEIINFAIEKEIESRELYKFLSEKAKSNEARELFSYLCFMEEKHEEFFKSLLNSVEKKQTPRVEENEEYYDYMKTLIELSRKYTLDLKNIDIDNLKQVLDYAMSREKDAIIFYSGLKDAVDKTNKSKIYTIIKEEAKHYTQISSLREKQ